MAQETLSVTLTILKANVYPYVEAMCALTGEPLPEQGTVTTAQMHHLIRQTMNAVQTGWQRETNPVVPPEGAEA